MVYQLIEMLITELLSVIVRQSLSKECRDDMKAAIEALNRVKRYF
jgi:hypothetical protein